MHIDFENNRYLLYSTWMSQSESRFKENINFEICTFVHRMFWKPAMAEVSIKSQKIDQYEIPCWQNY